MSVYDPLQVVLKERSGCHWETNFAELEQILRRPLPRSAYKYQAWWANQEGHGHSQTAAWRDAGWRTSNLDLARQTVAFDKMEPGEKIVQAMRGPGPDVSRSDLFSRAAAYLGTQDEAEIYAEGLKALVERESGRRLARLGGTMPSFEAAPRRRDQP